MDILNQIIFLLVLPISIACISWTVTHEEIFGELHQYCVGKSKSCKTLLQRKLFYIPTCEYCFSHYVTILILILTKYKLLLPDWRGYILAVFSLVWIANIYMSLYARIRIDIKAEKIEVELKEEKIAEHKDTPPL